MNIEELKEKLASVGVHINGDVTSVKIVENEFHHIAPGGIGVQTITIGENPFSIHDNERVWLDGEPITNEEAERLLNDRCKK